jgi:hypothetical protein
MRGLKMFKKKAKGKILTAEEEKKKKKKNAIISFGSPRPTASLRGGVGFNPPLPNLRKR